MIMKKILFILIVSCLLSETCINNETNWEFEYPVDFFNNQGFFIFLDLEFINSNYGDLVGTGGNCIDSNNEDCELNSYSCDVIGAFSENQSITWAYAGGCDNCDAMLVLISSPYNDIYFRYYQSSTNQYFVLIDLNGDYLSLDMIDPLEISVINDTIYLAECGDGNSDGLVNILDIVLAVNNILIIQNDYILQLDMDFNFEINISDVIIMIQNILRT